MKLITPMIPRPYQEGALKALDNHVRTKRTNPCIVIPTGGGKSAIIAWAIQMWKKEFPHFRCAVLAHRQELVEQNEEETRKIFGDTIRKQDIGVFSAGLGRRDYSSSILFASIDSICKRAGEFPPWDVIMIDEAHRIPFSGEGKYRRFLNESRVQNNKIVLVGYTASPYRMSGGNICHRDHLLNEVCYEVPISDLIKDGYLLNLRSKVGEAQPDLSGVKKRSGDYVTKAVSERATNVVAEAVDEAVRILHDNDRKSTVFFCVDVEHCERVSRELAKHGIRAPAVTNKTPAKERERIANEFKAGRHRAICNVDVYTEGFNAKCVDSIVLLRPTLSRGLYVQMVGRGSRLYEGLVDCLVLDFAGCIDEHGPIDRVDGDDTVMVVCGGCRESFSKATRRCPACDLEVPKMEVERAEAAEAVKRLHGTKASNKSILSSQPETHEVNTVFVARHAGKNGKPDSIRVSYQCGMSQFREWVCPDHDGFASKSAIGWLAVRGIKVPDKIPARYGSTVNFVLGNMFACQQIGEWTKTISVKKKGRYFEVVGYNRRMES